MVNIGLVWKFSWAMADTAGGSCHCTCALPLVRTCSHCLSGAQGALGVRAIHSALSGTSPSPGFGEGPMPGFWHCGWPMALGVLLVEERGRKEHQRESLSP